MPVTQDQIATKGQFRTKVVGDDGLPTRPWNQFFQKLEVTQQNMPSYFFGSHAQRQQTDATKLGIGSFFLETDTKNYFISDGTIWHQLGTTP